jgi:hypothetical protein
MSTYKKPDADNPPRGAPPPGGEESSEYLITPKGRRPQRLTRANAERLGIARRAADDTFISFGPRRGSAGAGKQE